MEFKSRRSAIMARNGMAASTHPLASAAGLRVLMEGGNAIDAAVAMAAVLNVAEPWATGVGGDAFALVWTAREKKVRALNASGRSPAAASLDELRSQGLIQIPLESAYSVTVPGVVSAWEAIVKRYGTMPLSELLRPAISYAKDGYAVHELGALLWEVAGGEKLRRRPSGGELLLNGRPPRAGEIVRLAALGGTLEAIAEGGAEAFYRGPLAERIARHVQELGGWLSTEDMANHRVDWVEPVCTDYRGHRVWQCPPNSQGVNLLMALNLAEGFDMRGMGFQTPATYHHLIECMRLAFADGLYHITDPRKMRVPTERLLSKEYATQRRRLIGPDRALDSIETGPALTHADTVYLSCVDGDGNACSFINSVYMGFGSGIVVPGTGIALHNRGVSFSLDPEHPNALEPNKRPFHTLIPGMVTRGGELSHCYGVMGAMQQAQGHFQVLVNMIDFGKSPQEALDAPRFSVRVNEGVVAIEDIVPDATIRELERRGHNVLVRDPHGVYFGGGQIIERDAETGLLKAGSEPRADGCAVGW